MNPNGPNNFLLPTPASAPFNNDGISYNIPPNSEPKESNVDYPVCIHIFYLLYLIQSSLSKDFLSFDN